MQEGPKSGVGEYALNLLEHLLDQDQENQYVIFLNHFRKRGFNSAAFQKYQNVEVKKFGFPNKLLNFCFWYLGWPKIDRMLGGADILFFPNINFAAWSPKTKVILTVHDLSFERYPETFSWKRRLWHFFINPKRLARKADKIIAVSDSTKSDLKVLYGLNYAKIKTIHSAVVENFAPIDRNGLKMIEIRDKYSLPYKFILYLGTIEPRKNIIGIIRAYNQLRNLKDTELDKYKLVLAGKPGWKYREIFKEVKDSPFRQDIIIEDAIEDEDRPVVYGLSSLFVYPSFFEGFGFPPLEAMASGVPVIASNNSSLPEIVGDAGILIDPDKPDEIFQAIKAVLQSRELSDKLRTKGIEQARKFSWPKTAEKFLETVGILRT